MRTIRTLSVLAAVALGAGAITGAASAGSAPAAPSASARSCAAVTAPISRASIHLPTTGARIDTATWVADSGGQCRVVGRILPVDPQAPPIRFQVNLPKRWNHRALQYGGGGYDGTLVTGLGPYPLQPVGQRTPLQQGFVTLGSDGGHEATRPGFDASFGLNDEALLNYGQQSIKKTHDAAMVLIRRIYHRAPGRFYFAGFSQGGHEAIDAAGRYPKDYDGVIAGTPTYDVTMMHAGIGSLYRDALYSDGGAGWMNQKKVATLVAAVYARCDGLDRAKDGVIADPEGCREVFDVTTLRCADGEDTGDDCLSDAQIRAANTLATGKDLGFPIEGNRFAAAQPIYSGGTFTRFTLGTAPQPKNPVDGTEAFNYSVLDAISKYIVTRDPTLDSLHWNLSTAVPRIQQVGRIMDSTKVDLAPFAKRGGKVLMTTGTADDGVSPYNTAQLYDRQVQRFGTAKLRSFLRFWAMPGFSHGFGPFNASYDALPALMRWVEHGTAPSHLVMTDTNAATKGRTRPLCEYPTWPRYRSGSVERASSFTCVR